VSFRGEKQNKLKEIVGSVQFRKFSIQNELISSNVRRTRTEATERFIDTVAAADEPTAQKQKRPTVIGDMVHLPSLSPLPSVVGIRTWGIGIGSEELNGEGYTGLSEWPLVCVCLVTD
jgi:hypothetical protein